MALEAEFWAALTDLARRRGVTLSALVAATDEARDTARPLASALRVYALLHAAPRSGEANVKEQHAPAQPTAPPPET